MAAHSGGTGQTGLRTNIELKPTKHIRLIWNETTENNKFGRQSNTDEAMLNGRLTLAQESISQSEAKNLPYGRPINVIVNSTYCLLHHEGYVSGYSQNLFMPLWSAYTVETQGEGSSLPPTVSDCLRPDGRVPEAKSQNCSEYLPDMSITHSFLHPPNFNSSSVEQYDSLITSNLVPMYKEFLKIWNYLNNILLLKYASERNGVNVVTGPVFDYNFDGQVDSPAENKSYVDGSKIPIPTHYFMVLTSCNDTIETPVTCSGNLDVLSFIIPHRPDNTESCATKHSHFVYQPLVQHGIKRFGKIEIYHVQLLTVVQPIAYLFIKTD
ncbi:unnamed protein product [Ranitomeya imitator]|uniref:Extracellular Endonuclease subunit A domain-containing protein n=1 Tax=Ranitomeya imitator TaxID=111125 RepID=A0ABN9LCN3_9NEOB|nr:unnamed protein product [Ranitomeya imitator]